MQPSGAGCRRKIRSRLWPPYLARLGQSVICRDVADCCPSVIGTATKSLVQRHLSDPSDGRLSGRSDRRRFASTEARRTKCGDSRLDSRIERGTGWARERRFPALRAESRQHVSVIHGRRPGGRPRLSSTLTNLRIGERRKSILRTRMSLILPATLSQRGTGPARGRKASWNV